MAYTKGGAWGAAASAAAPGAAGAEARGGPGGEFEGCWTDALRGVVEEEIDREVSWPWTNGAQ